MKYYIIFALFITLSTARPNDIENADISPEAEVFGARTTNLKSSNQTKRDLSLSYAATNIDSKEGTRVKTITVIKNLSKKNEKLAINPELHKNEEWANAFRDNFESYGHIPDVPDIDDLFEFVNKKDKKVKEEKEKPTEAPKTVESEPPKVEAEKPVIEPSMENEQEEEAQVVSNEPVTTSSEATAEKIKGDAELLPAGRLENNSSQPQMQSQSLSINKLRLRESLVNVNYSTPQHAVHQYFDNYIQANPKGYNYAAPPLPPPCVNAPTNSVSVSTTSGRTYDIPVAGGASGGPNPYIAPAISKKAQITPPNNNPNAPAIPTQQNYPVNSLLPPLQPNTLPTITATTRLPAPVFTSQNPYVAPNLLQSGNPPANRLPATIPPYRGGVSNLRTNIFGQGANRPNTGRSRGLKYYF